MYQAKFGVKKFFPLLRPGTPPQKSETWDPPRKSETWDPGKKYEFGMFQCMACACILIWGGPGNLFL